MPRKKAAPAEIDGWPPRWLSPVTPDEIKWGDGDHAALWIEQLCRVTEDSIGSRANELLRLRPWQLMLLRYIFARRMKLGRLKHRRGLVGIARKNGKTTLAAACGLYGLLSDFPGGMQGREIYCCAGDREQAKIVFGTALQMVEASPALSDVTKLYRETIEVPETHSIFRVLSAEAYTKEGLNPTLVIFDEVHVQPNRELWDVMALALGAREEPLMLGITTAGVRYDSTGLDSVCYQLYEYGKKVASGEVDDPAFMFAWWEPNDPLAPHDAETTWKQSNPGFGDIVSPEDFKSALLTTPEPEFRIKRCNQWVEAAQLRYLPLGAWESVQRPGEIPAGARVVLGFDGSFDQDSTALIAATVEEHPHIAVAGAWERPPPDSPEAANWKIPVLEVEEAIRTACRYWSVAEIAYDPYLWRGTFQLLLQEGLPCVEYPQSPQRMTEATQSFYEAVVKKALTQDGDARLARHLDNAVYKVDSRGSRIYKESSNSKRRIDLAVAALICHYRATWHFRNAPETTFFGAAYR